MSGNESRHRQDGFLLYFSLRRHFRLRFKNDELMGFAHLVSVLVGRCVCACVLIYWSVNVSHCDTQLLCIPLLQSVFITSSCTAPDADVFAIQATSSYPSRDKMHRFIACSTIHEYHDTCAIRKINFRSCGLKCECSERQAGRSRVSCLKGSSRVHLRHCFCLFFMQRGRSAYQRRWVKSRFLRPSSRH